MRTLYKLSEIDKGIYAGEIVKDCLKRNGRKAILELLKYYDFCEEIMREYHFHLAPHKENNTAKAVERTIANNGATAKKTKAGEIEKGVAKSVAMDDMTEIGEETLDLPDNVDLDFNDWVESCSNRKCNVLYDPEDEACDAYYGGTWMRANNFDYAMSNNV